MAFSILPNLGVSTAQLVAVDVSLVVGACVGLRRLVALTVSVLLLSHFRRARAN